MSNGPRRRASAPSGRTTAPKDTGVAVLPVAQPDDKDFLIKSLRNQIARQSAQIGELEALLLKIQHGQQQALISTPAATLGDEAAAGS